MEEEKKLLTIDESAEGVRGKVSLDESVVATIAAIAAKSVEGVHSLGKSSLLSFGGKQTKGVGAEVGKQQAAFDLDIVVEYGADIRKVAAELRQRIAENVDKMAGRKVVEVNIHVLDIKLPEAVKEPTTRVK